MAAQANSVLAGLTSKGKFHQAETQIKTSIMVSEHLGEHMKKRVIMPIRAINIVLLAGLLKYNGL